MMSEKRGQVEILWDTFGVPHIFGKTEQAVFYGFGWAQAHNHGNVLLRLYGEARGRASEYWGESYVDADYWTLANDIPTRGAEWYRSSPANFRENLDAFAQGINDYAGLYPEKIDRSTADVLPITGIDVMRHAHRLLNYFYITSATKVLGPSGVQTKMGSNAWAVAPSKSASANTMLLANPHLPWARGPFMYFEADLHGPDFHMYGATQVGLPVLRFMFNERMGFTNTVNTMLGATTYELKRAGEGYLFDGKVVPFEQRKFIYKVKQGDGSLLSKELMVRSSVHGPVFEREDGKYIALRVAGLDRCGALQQYWDMGKSRSFAEFQQVMRRLQIPMFNIIYADKEGHIYYVDNGIIPKHDTGDVTFWSGLVRGDTSETFWADTHEYEDLPKVVDPPTGWLQNSNDPPWLATYPSVIRHADYPAYMAAPGPESFRSQQSIRLLDSAGKITFEDFAKRKLSTYSLMAERLLPDLIAAAMADPDPQIQAAGLQFENWDRDMSSESRAALLFEAWAARFTANFVSFANFRIPWSDSAPIDTPTGIADVKEAIAMLREAVTDIMVTYGSVDRCFGEVSRFQIDDVEAPGNGGYEIFRAFRWSTPKDGKRVAVHGESWVSLVEFSTPIKAIGLMSYGNASQPDSPHRTDQLRHLSNETFRTLWTTRAEVEQHLVAHTLF